MKIITANIGFVTNSSSVVYHFPKEVFENEDIQAFIKAFEIENGYIGGDLWDRANCGTLAVSKEQKIKIRGELKDNPYGANTPSINTESDEVVLIYGDEYQDITTTLISMMYDVAKKMGVNNNVTADDYN